MENMLGRLGAATRRSVGKALGALAGVATLFWLALRPTSWPRTSRNVLARQVLFTGLEAARFVSLVALLVGLSVVVQLQVWLSKVGQSGLLGPVLVAILIREVGPLLTNFVVIGRSGAAIAAEMASMRVGDEVHVLEAQGLDPMLYLVLPRMIGTAASIFALTVLFAAVSLVSGFFSGVLMGANTGSPGIFVHSVFSAVTPADVLNLVAKTWIPGALTAVICCQEGLGISGAMTEIPQAATRGIVRSVMALFVTSAFISVITYL